MARKTISESERERLAQLGHGFALRFCLSGDDELMTEGAMRCGFRRGDTSFLLMKGPSVELSVADAEMFCHRFAGMVRSGDDPRLTLEMYGIDPDSGRQATHRV
jgi:hypothetical protein